MASHPKETGNHDPELLGYLQSFVRAQQHAAAGDAHQQPSTQHGDSQAQPSPPTHAAPHSVNQAQQMAYPVHGVPTGELAPYHTPYDMNSPGESSLLLLINLTRLTIVLGFNNPAGGISYHTPQDAHSAAFPPDTNYAQGYGAVNPYPVITTTPYPPMPLTYATRPSSAGPEEKGDNAQPVLLEWARGRVPGHAGLEGEHNAPGQMPAVQELRSYPGRGLASGAMSSPQYIDLVELGRRPHPTQPHAQPLGMGGRGNLVAPGTQYQSPPYNALAQSASSQHPMLSSTIGQGHNASAESSAAASLHIPQAIPGASLP